MKPFAMLLLCAVACSAGDLEVPFALTPRQQVMVIEARVNGRKAVLVFDTGASHTVISGELIGLSPAELQMARFANGGPGMRGESLAATIGISIAGRPWPAHRVAVMNLAELAKTYDRKIDGLLGQDMIHQFDRVTIDLKRRRLIFTDD